MADLTGVNDTLPVRIGGVSSSSGLPDNYADVDSSGNLFVKPVTAGLVSSSTAALYSNLTGGIYNTSLPSLTTGQQSALQLDSSSRLYVNVGSTAPPNNLVSTGTLTGTGQTVNLTLQGTASVNIDVSGPGFVGTLVVIENTPSQSRVLGVFNSNTSPIAASITANGNYRVVGLATSSTVTVQFSAYTSGSATINIYGSTAPFIVMPYSANAANVLVTSYLNDGSGNSISSSSGSLLVKDNADGPVTPGTVASASMLMGGQYNSTLPTLSNTQQSAIQLDSNGRILIGSVALLPTDSDKNVTGTITALNGTVVIAANGTSSVNASVSGTWVGTLVMEGQSGDGIWYALAVGNPNGGLNISSFTTNNLYTVGSGGFTQIRVRASAYTSGTVNVTMDASSGSAQTLAVDANGNQQIVGNVASGTADSGNGVKTSAVYNSTLPTFTNGQRADNQSDANGAQLVSTKVPRTYSAPQTASVGTTSTLILAANANRKGLYLSNTTATQQISLGFNGNAAAYQYGLTLFPGEKFWMDEYSFSTGAIYAITSGSATYIGVQEIT